MHGPGCVPPASLPLRCGQRHKPTRAGSLTSFCARRFPYAGNIYKPVLDANRALLEAAEAQGKKVNFYNAAVESLGVEALAE